MPKPPQITMWSYVWDYFYDGIDDVLKYQKEVLGLTAVSVATRYHLVEHLRPHGKGPFIYRHWPALHFRPSVDPYPGTRMRAPLSDIVRQGNPFRRIADRCHALGLELISWTVCNHDDRMGERNPELCQRNCFGDIYPETLCPANPDVRAFLAGLAEDLTVNYGVQLMELELPHYQSKRHYHRHEKISIPFAELDDFLLGLCFCPFCRRRARDRRVDAVAVQAQARAALRHVFETGEPHEGTLAEFLHAHPQVAAYVEMRVATVTSLLKRLKQASGKADVSAMSWASREASGADAGQMARTVDSVTVLAYSPEVDEVRRIIGEAAKAAGGGAKIRAGFHTYPPNTPDKATLLRNVEAAVDLGVRAFSFYNYGIMPRRSLGWTREAAALIHRRLG